MIKNMRWKEIAKFFAGVATEETIIHSTLGLSGVLPLTFFGFTLTAGLNTILAILWPVVLIILFYYAWIKK